MENNKTVNVFAVGVGGQGIIRFSDILAEVVFRAGFDVKKSEIHGLSQRGGSVTSNIRWGEKVYTPVVIDGEVDFLLSLEKLEALRYAHTINKNGKIIVNDFIVEPSTVKSGTAKIPENIDSRLQEYGDVTVVPATAMAIELGNKRASNTVILGVFSQFLKDIPESIWLDVLTEAFPEKIRQLNLDAFQAGRQYQLS